MTDVPTTSEPGSTSIEDWRALVQGFEGRSMLLRAYDAAASGLEDYPGDKWLQHRAVLALARSDATETAVARYAEFGLAEYEDDVEIGSLGARLEKDLAWLAEGKERGHLAAKAALAIIGVERQAQIEDDALAFRLDLDAGPADFLRAPGMQTFKVRASSPCAGSLVRFPAGKLGTRDDGPCCSNFQPDFVVTSEA